MAKTSKKDEAAVQPIIVKKIKKGGEGHHGGAWKVAYADFVTAMMAFFLLLWLLNVATEDQLEAISSYFDPTHIMISDTTSGAGGLMAGQSLSAEGAMVTNVQPVAAPSQTGLTGQESKPRTELEQLEQELRAQEEQEFQKAKEELEEAIRENPELKELAENVMIDITPEGLRIQIVDQEGKPMFPLGSAEMYDYTRKLMKVVAKVVNDMPNEISIRGHTDSHQYSPGAKYTNWELSADRANTSRRALLEDGVPAGRLANVMGKADRDHLVEKPTDPRNRRISIILLHEEIEKAIERGALGDKAREAVKRAKQTPPPAPYQKTPGDVYFP